MMGGSGNARTLNWNGPQARMAQTESMTELSVSVALPLMCIVAAKYVRMTLQDGLQMCQTSCACATDAI